ncbi:hypothetical protein Avbf_13059 [Armadillidium vulgare]|nr:hypothetical protein Avbf_13059 [Armadillidium vulgare]
MAKFWNFLTPKNKNIEEEKNVMLVNSNGKKFDNPVIEIDVVGSLESSLTSVKESVNDPSIRGSKDDSSSLGSVSEMNLCCSDYSKSDLSDLSLEERCDSENWSRKVSEGSLRSCRSDLGVIPEKRRSSHGFGNHLIPFDNSNGLVKTCSADVLCSYHLPAFDDDKKIRYSEKFSLTKSECGITFTESTRRHSFSWLRNPLNIEPLSTDSFGRKYRTFWTLQPKKKKVRSKRSKTLFHHQHDDKNTLLTNLQDNIDR